MDSPTKPSVRIPTTAWLAEQRAKQDRYAAGRQAWARTLERRAMPDEDDAPAPATAADDMATDDLTAPARTKRQRGIVHDPRQQRFEF